MTYFYPVSCAHHAFCMAIDFGMKFTKRDGFWTPEGLLSVTGAGGYKIEIAEESLGLLEPRVGDIAMCDGLAVRIIPDGELQKHAHAVCISDLRHFEKQRSSNVAASYFIGPSKRRWTGYEVALETTR